MALTDEEEIELLQLLELEERDNAEASLLEFIRQGWHVLEPATRFVEGRALAAICLHLEAVARGEIRQLLINVPPGFSKSLAVNVFFPAWIWGPRNQPHKRWIHASRGDTLSTRDSVKCRDLILSDWYRRNWGSRVVMHDFQNEKTRFKNKALGERMIASVCGKATGERGDMLVIDDPHDAAGVLSDGQRNSVIDPWWKQQFANRVNDPETAVRVVIMQRLHEGDLSGHLIREEAGEWVHLCLPMEFEAARKCVTRYQAGPREGEVCWEDWRAEPGELLWPERFGEKWLAAEKRRLGSYGAAGQLQQAPVPAAGGIFSADWWKYFCDAPGACTCGFPRPPARMDGSLTSLDCAFKRSDDTDYVVFGRLDWQGANVYVRDVLRDRMSFTQTVAQARLFYARHSDVHCHLVEEKANGAAVLDTLHGVIGGLIAVCPTDSKEARAAAISPWVEAGNFWLPAHAHWVDAFVTELRSFPRGANDDQVDMLTQGALRIRQGDAPPPILEAQVTTYDEIMGASYGRQFGL